MIAVTGNAIGRDLLCFRAVALHAIRLLRHENVGGLTALARVMAVVAFHTRVPGVIETRLRHPSIDQKRFGEDGHGVGHVFHLVAVGASRKVRTRRGILFSWIIRIAGQKHCLLQELAAAKLLSQLFDLFRHEALHLPIADFPFVQLRVIAVLRGQGAQEIPDQFRVAMRDVQLRIVLIEE